MSSTANTLAEDHMFEISNKTQILDRDTKAYFHKITANLTFFTKKNQFQLTGCSCIPHYYT